MITLNSPDLDIQKIADSGQCFRMEHTGSGRYTLVALGRVLDIDARPDGCALHCTAKQYHDVWRDYFDIDTDYAAFRAAVPHTDSFLTRASQAGRGIRILRQDAWEMLITFIISQRKSIPAIRRCVQQLAVCAGRPIRHAGQVYHAFPTPRNLARLSSQQLAACGLGYRAGYVHEAARLAASGRLNLPGLSAADDETLRQALLAVPGVGEKVANCVMLFGFHRLQGFPKDVWINRVIDEEYGGCFDLAPYAGFEGVMQQYMFYYGRLRAKSAIS